MSACLTADAIAHSVFEGSAEKATLAPFSARFESGRFYAIGGPSGAGKTTLISILSLTLRPRQGAVEWNGIALSNLPPREAALWRRAWLGLVFQHSRLLSRMTVAEHIEMAATIRASAGARQEGLWLLERLGLSGKAGQLPDQLSGGEKQRLALAQALCARPGVVLADEPTAALDQENSIIVAETLRDHARSHDAIVVCVTHDKAVSGHADQTLALDKA